MKILAFDTSFGKPSIAIIENDEILTNEVIDDERKPAQLLVFEIDKILEKQNISYQDLSAIATAKGPSSFTSTRIGLSCIKAIKLATNIKIFTFDSLQIMAHFHKDFQGKILAIIDANMNEFFIAEFSFSNNKINILQETKLVNLTDLEKFAITKNHLIIGNCQEIVANIFDAKIGFEISQKNDYIFAQKIAFMTKEALENKDAKFENSDALYLRMPNIVKRKN